MVAYNNNELVSSSEFAKKFGSYLSKIKDKTVNKLAVLKNNKIEAVLVSIDDYEKMQNALKFQEEELLRKDMEEAFVELEDIKRGDKKGSSLDQLWDQL